MTTPYSNPRPRTTTPWANVTPANAIAALSDYRIIDVRQPSEFTSELGHVPGSELIPLGQLDPRSFDPAQPTLVVCRSGARSAAACDRLVAAGVEVVHNLAGGMMAFNALHGATCRKTHAPAGLCPVRGEV